ncbi:hypothetical protein CALCODRAFT_556674 [Calocera cornea HHB12733]|uniref:Uncharacterized protein n=1 Tax=Calocera cornea HHB12733 TaxID=1353952 RepID=A0A165EHX7_9BASI|nr:hypothetical protein CALCODRAFT_556674 [Calocera cornea HHB12733]
MSVYLTSLWANSPLLTYHPTLGSDIHTNWISKPFVVSDTEPQYYTSAPQASVEFWLYCDQFSLNAGLWPYGGGAPPCDFNVTINGDLQNVTNIYHQYNLPVDWYHVELALFCPEEGQQAQFWGVDFQETQGSKPMNVINTLLNASQVHTAGRWHEEVVFQGYFYKNLTEYTSSHHGAKLSYSFKGVRTTVFGAVGPENGAYIITIDGVPQPTLTGYNPVVGNTTVLWLLQGLDNDQTHTVEIVSLDGELKIQAIQNTELFPLPNNA